MSRPPELVTRPDRLLLLQPRWMGDVLLCTPAIREARHALPHARIDFVTEAGGAEVLRGNPHLDSVLVDDRTIRSRLGLIGQVARAGYDAVIDFRSTNSTAQLAIASRAPVRVGIRGRGPRNAAYTRLLPRQPLSSYAARHKLDMLVGIGVPVQYITDLSLDLDVGIEARGWAAERWEALALTGERVVAVTPVSREAYKQWGTDRWAQLCDRIGRSGARVLLTYGPGERDQARAVAEASRVRPLWEEVETATVARLGAVLERCDLWTGNDGGTKHVAVAVGTPTLAVSRWQIGRVWTDSTSSVLHQFIERDPPGGCDLKCARCVHLGCLRAIPVDELEERVRVELGRGAG